MGTEDGNANIAMLMSTFDIDAQTAVDYLDAANGSVEIAASNLLQKLEEKISGNPQTDPSKTPKYRIYEISE